MSDENDALELDLGCPKCGYPIGEDWFGDRDFPPHDVACPECGYSSQQAKADLDAFVGGLE